MTSETGGLPDSDQIGDMFGYVTDEDRQRWAAARQRLSTKAPSTAKQMAAAAAEAAMELGSHGIQAKLNAEHQVMARDRNDVTTKKTKTTITETIDFEERDDREVIDDGYEF